MRFKMLALVTASLLAVALPVAADVAKPAYGTWGYDAEAMDRSVKPGDDFWAYVNGTWDKKTPIAPGSDLGRAIRDLVRSGGEGRSRDRRKPRQRPKPFPARPASRRFLRQLHGRGRDRGGRQGAAQAHSSDIDGVKTRAQLLSLFVKPGFASPVDVAIIPNFKDPNRYSAIAGQATLGMPSREYYLLDNAKNGRAPRRLSQLHRHHSEARGSAPEAKLRPTGSSRSKRRCRRTQGPAAERRDIDKIYNPMTRAQLARLAPQFQWNSTLAKGGPGSDTQVIVTEPSVVAGAGKILGLIPLSTWKEWLDFRFASDHANLLPQGIRRRAIRVPLEAAQGASSNSANAGSAGCFWSTARWARP